MNINMSIGMRVIERIDSIRAVVDQLGLRMSRGPGYLGDEDTITLYPNGNNLPIYARDAVLFTGNLHDLEVWTRGVAWARQYDSYLGVVNDKRRAQYEAKELARQEQVRYNTAKAETFKILKTTHKDAA